MPNFGMPPQQMLLLAKGTVTTNGTSANLTLPPASSYRIICQVNTITGTTPTLVMILATSFDNGTTYNEILSSVTMSTCGSQFTVRPYLGIGDAATCQNSVLLGAATDLAAAVVNNGPINPGFIKLRFVVSGTSPSFGAVNVFVGAVPQDLSD